MTAHGRTRPTQTPAFDPTRTLTMELTGSWSAKRGRSLRLLAGDQIDQWISSQR